MSNHRPPGARRVLLLVGLGAAAIAGVIAWPGSGDGPDSAGPAVTQAPGADRTLEVKTVLLRGSIARASWRERAAVDEDPMVRHDPSFGADPFREDARDVQRRERYARTLEDTVAPIDGLGVYVAPVGSGEGSR